VACVECTGGGLTLSCGVSGDRKGCGLGEKGECLGHLARN